MMEPDSTLAPSRSSEVHGGPSTSIKQARVSNYQPFPFQTIYFTLGSLSATSSDGDMMMGPQ